VVAREAQRGERVETRLAAYVVPHGEVSWRELREHLRARLPEYMVPAAVVLLNEMPLTSSGKLDRRALPAPEEVEGVGESYAAPRTAIEELLCGIWSDVLGLDQVGVESNFFDLGGHSLLATQVVSRVREAFGVELAVRSMFETPTVAGLAEQIEALSREAHSMAAPPIVRVLREGGAPLSFAQQRLWFMDQLEPGTSLYNLPVAVRMTGELDVRALERTLSEMIRRHEVLRTTFTSIDGEPVQVVGEPQDVTIPITDLQEWDESERELEASRLASEEVRRPFDLSSGPLLRASLLRLGEQDHVVLMTMHHIISDGWSTGVLVREVEALYEAYTRGAESPLAELPVQYADYAAWQRGWLQGEVLERQLGYWREQLKGAPVLALRTDHPRPAVQAHNGARVSFVLPHELSASLHALSRREGVTLFMTLLAAFQTLLHRYTRQEDITVGADIANRNRSETESLIGFFINMLVMRADLSGSPTFRDLLRQVRERALGAYAHQDLPFEKLVEELQPKRDPSRHPLFDVVFAFYNTPMRDLDLGEVSLRPFEFGSWTIQYDLVLSVIDMNGSLTGSIAYDCALFVESTITRMVSHYQTLLENIVADPDQRIANLRLFSDTETGGLALADFPKTKLNQKDFESLLAALSKTAKS
jgi:acyl carrier protein